VDREIPQRDMPIKEETIPGSPLKTFIAPLKMKAPPTNVVPPKLPTVALALLAGAMLALSLPARADAVRASVGAQLVSPSTNLSTGLQDVTSLSDTQGPLPGNVTASAQIAASQTGSTGQGDSGTASVQESASAQAGHLEASVAVSTSAHPAANYPYTAASANGAAFARFEDTTTVYNPDFALNTLIPIEIVLHLNWTGGNIMSPFGHGGNNNGSDVGADATLGVAFVDTINAAERMAAGNVPEFYLDHPGGPLDFFVANGHAFDWAAQLSVYANNSTHETGFPYFQDFYPVLDSSAFSTGSLDFAITSALAGTTFTSASGHDYAGSASVPEAGSGVLTVVAGCVWAAMLRYGGRRGRARAA
jgi:hypothetical protein